MMKPKDSCKSFRKTSTAKGREGRKHYKTPAKLNIFKNAKNEEQQKGKMRMYICEPLQVVKPVFFRSEDATFDNGKKALDYTRENHETSVYTYVLRFIMFL